MNGWQRIGVVLAALFGVPAFFLAYDQYDTTYGTIYPSEETKALDGQEFWNALWREANKQNPAKYEGCMVSTVEMEPPISEFSSDYIITCENKQSYTFFWSFFWGLIPGIFVFFFGYTIAWVVAGFRSKG